MKSEKPYIKVFIYISVFVLGIIIGNSVDFNSVVRIHVDDMAPQLRYTKARNQPRETADAVTLATVADKEDEDGECHMDAIPSITSPPTKYYKARTTQLPCRSVTYMQFLLLPPPN